MSTKRDLRIFDEDFVDICCAIAEVLSGKILDLSKPDFTQHPQVIGSAHNSTAEESNKTASKDHVATGDSIDDSFVSTPKEKADTDEQYKNMEKDNNEISMQGEDKKDSNE